jgi:hypothetical protein
MTEATESQIFLAFFSTVHPRIHAAVPKPLNVVLSLRAQSKSLQHHTKPQKPIAMEICPFELARV